MSYNDIFNKYAEIMIKNAEKSSKKILEESGRVDSRSIKELENLYNLKPEDKKYKNIIEEAHPEPSIVSPAHDKINGLVENENERQNITINILNRKPTFANVFHRKYAETKHDLVLSLVRTANFLDAKDQEDLTKLADTCIEQLAKKKELKKIAVAPLATPLVIAAVAVPAAILVGIAAIQNMNMSDIGFERNLLRLKSELEDLEKKTGGWGLTALKPEFIKSVGEVQSHLNTLLSTYKKFETLVNETTAPKDFNQLIEMAKENEAHTKDVQLAFKAFAEDLKQVLPMLDKMEENFKSQTFKEKQVSEKGILSQIGDVFNVGGFLHGKNSLISDDFNDVVRAIPSFKKSALEVKDLLIKSSKRASEAKAEIDRAKSEGGAEELPSSSTAVSGVVPQKTQEEKDKEEINKKLSNNY